MIILSSLLTSLQKELGSFNSNEEFPDLYRYINSAINYIYNYRDWDWNKKTYTMTYTTANTEQTMSIYPYKVFYVKFWDEIMNVYDREQWFVAQDTGNAVWVYENIFITWTAGTYDILYARTAPILTALDTVIDMPDFFKDVIQMIAVHFAYKDIKDYQTANAILGQANAILNPSTERTVNTLPRNQTRLGSAYSF